MRGKNSSHFQQTGTAEDEVSHGAFEEWKALTLPGDEAQMIACDFSYPAHAEGAGGGMVGHVPHDRAGGRGSSEGPYTSQGQDEDAMSSKGPHLAGAASCQSMDNKALDSLLQHLRSIEDFVGRLERQLTDVLNRRAALRREQGVPSSDCVVLETCKRQSNMMLAASPGPVSPRSFSFAQYICRLRQLTAVCCFLFVTFCHGPFLYIAMAGLPCL